MNNPFLIGEKIYLRGLKEEDLSGEYFQWLNDKDVTCYLESGYFPNTQVNMENYYEKINNSNSILMLAIIEKSTDKHIGNIKLEPINWIHRTAKLGIMIGNKESYGKGFGTEAIKLIVEYSFDELNLRKITLGVVAENKPALKVYKKIGFELEGRRKKQSFNNGHYCDGLIMGLFRKDYNKKEGG